MDPIDKTTNLQNYCRTCGNATDELISIFDDEGLGYELNVKISTYLNLQVRICFNSWFVDFGICSTDKNYL